VTEDEYLLNIWVGDPKDKRRYSMSDFKKLAHAIWDCKYHIVWCPKYRFRIMKGAVQKSVKEIISQLCEWKKLEILELNVLEDHVHLVISIPWKKINAWNNSNCGTKFYPFRVTFYSTPFRGGC
jgi:REP element-mobilizing transposase RayT